MVELVTEEEVYVGLHRDPHEVDVPPELFPPPRGRGAARGRTHQSVLRDPPPKEGVVIDKDREKSGARRFDIPLEGALEDLTPLVKPITQEMCDKFSPGRSYHNDREEAKKLGFPDIVVQGMMSVCFLSELLTRRFGAGWYCGGKMNVRLANIVWGGGTPHRPRPA